MELVVKIVVLVLLGIVSRVNSCTPPLECLPVNECLENEELKNDFIFNCNQNAGTFKRCCLPINEQTVLSLPKLDQQRERARNILPVRCGYHFSTKIIRTGNAMIGEYPWNVLLAYVKKSQRASEYRCGGTLITSRFVLTAAQCLTDPNYTLQFVRLGELNLKENPDCEFEGDQKFCSDTPRDIAVERIIPHPEYRIGSLENDIGLILLTENVSFTEFTGPICLPVGLNIPEHLNENTAIVASGWGKDNKDGESGKPALTFSHLVEINTTACGALTSTNVTSDQACARSRHEQNVCSADIGGPLFYSAKTAYDDYAAIQLGVVTSASGICNSSMYPIVSTRVRHYVDWILDVISTSSVNKM